MVDYEKYRDIAPYQGEDVRAAVERISKHPELLYAFACAIYKGEGAEVESQRMGLVKYVLEVLKTVGSYDDFQHKITSALLLKNVIDRSMQSFTVSATKARARKARHSSAGRYSSGELPRKLSSDGWVVAVYSPNAATTEPPK